MAMMIHDADDATMINHKALLPFNHILEHIISELPPSTNKMEPEARAESAPSYEKAWV